MVEMALWPLRGNEPWLGPVLYAVESVSNADVKTADEFRPFREARRVGCSLIAPLRQPAPPINRTTTSTANTNFPYRDRKQAITDRCLLSRVSSVYVR